MQGFAGAGPESVLEELAKTFQRMGNACDRPASPSVVLRTELFPV